ncbi:BA14K family protein [Devosia oryzisoli]|uniref:BA14K family protein n=1 Tax=Devosia oryzisoli TaxID=2774138 RepID=UPI0020C0BA92|nr:BA14K family protein [Devosia oryzisoli]
MKTSLKAIASSLIVGLLAVSSAVPAQAQVYIGQRDRVITTYCDRHSYERDCRDWRDGRWGHSDYNRFYHRHQSGLDSIASGFFGFTFGAILGSALANSSRNHDRVIGYVGGYDAHVAACYDRYRSYDERSDTFLGYDGVRHRCRL